MIIILDRILEINKKKSTLFRHPISIEKRNFYNFLRGQLTIGFEKRNSIAFSAAVSPFTRNVNGFRYRFSGIRDKNIDKRRRDIIKQLMNGSIAKRIVVKYSACFFPPLVANPPSFVFPFRFRFSFHQPISLLCAYRANLISRLFDQDKSLDVQ